MTALKNKYFEQTFQITSALIPIMAADLKQGITTTVVYVDDAAAMAAVGGTPVSDSKDEKQNKDAIDAIYNHYTPDYLMILGSVDIIPHCSLLNPAGDKDLDVPSDLPYASSAAYNSGRLIEAYTSDVNRIVGRLPDLTGVPSTSGAKDTSYFLRVMATAADRSRQTVAKYKDYFSVSAEVWNVSTQITLTDVYGNSSGMLSSPPSGPVWNKEQLKLLSHFINLHGSKMTDYFVV